MPPKQQGNSIDQQIFEKRCDDFVKDLQLLEEKHRIVMLPVLKHLPVPGMPGASNGLIPSMIYKDKDSFEREIAQAQEQMVGVSSIANN